MRVIPRNGSGVYSLPESPFVDGTTISAAPVNNNYSDIATAMTGSVAADGQTPRTGGLVGTTAAFSGVVTAADGTAGENVVNNSQFERSIAGQGYQVFPGGVMMQWGSVNPLTSPTPITFPVAFVALYNIQVTYAGNVGPVLSATGGGLTGFSLQTTASGGGTSAWWFAIGRRF